MLMTIGPIALDIWPLNPTETERTTGAEYAEKGIIGRRPALEFMGEAAEQLRVSVSLFPAKLGGLDELANLQALRASGRPQYVMRGDGRPLGWFVIASLTESSSYLDAQGVGQVIEVEIEMTRGDGPDDANFHGAANFN